MEQKIKEINIKIDKLKVVKIKLKVYYFIKCHSMRNKYEDSLNSLNNLLDAIRDENNKII